MLKELINALGRASAWLLFGLMFTEAICGVAALLLTPPQSPASLAGNMVRRLVAFAFVVFAATCVAMIAARPAFAETRVALVIGNGTYRTLPQLSNPTHDASALRASLIGLGFDVEIGLDLTRDQMDAAIIRFARKARQADVALVFFGGHGIQHRGVNYLAPVDAEVKDEADLRRFPTAQQIVEDLQAAKNVRILILDACRDNKVVEHMASLLPASRAAGFSRGLSRMEKAEGTLIAFSTQPNMLALDGSGDNSPFMAALLKHLPEPGLDVRLVFARARADVYVATEHEQLPELSDSLVGEFAFKQVTPGGPLSPTMDPDASARADFALAKQIGTIEMWDAFSRKYPSFYPAVVDAERQKLKSPAGGQQVVLHQAPPILVLPPTSVAPVAQRAAFLVEAPEEQAHVKTYVGTVVWRLDNVSNGSGQPLSSAVRADVDIPEAKLKVSMIFQKNFDASLSASHTITLQFTPAPDSPVGSIKEIKVPQLRGLEAQAGFPLDGIPVPIMKNYFLVGLSRGASETANLDLIKRREWIDVPMILQSNNRIAKLTFEKNTTGARGIEDALAGWQTPESTIVPVQPLDKATANVPPPERAQAPNDEKPFLRPEYGILSPERSERSKIPNDGKSAVARQLAALAPAPTFSFATASKISPVDGGTEDMRYLSVVYGMIVSQKHDPPSLRAQNLHGTVIVAFFIDDAGRLVQETLYRTSGYSDMDAAALEAVNRAAPFPPPPPGTQRHLLATIEFKE
jgi:TonB family protein